MHGVRIWFSLEGYKDEHPTRWMKFLYTERANLYKKYLVPLVQGMKPNIQWDIQDLTGMSVITYWNQQESNGTTYQHIETIIPDGKKMYPVIVEAGKTEDAPPQDDGDVPF